MEKEKNKLSPVKLLLHILRQIIVVILVLLCLFPFFMVVINAAKSNRDITGNPLALPTDWGLLLENFSKLINNTQFRYWQSFFNSIIITAISLGFLILFASMAAWILSRSKKKWANFIFMAFVAALVIPFQVVMLPLISNFRTLSDFLGLKFLGTYGGLIFAYLGFGGSISIFILHGFIKNIPYELEEAAYIDGCPKEQIFFRIIMPLLRPIHMTILILSGVWIWNDFLLPSLMLGMNGKIKTLPIAVTTFVGSYVKQWDLILTSTLLAMIPIIIVFIIAQKYIIKGMVEGAIK